MISFYSIIISIHALAKRATQSLFDRHGERNYFNPRPRKEGDLEETYDKFKTWDFNPRPRKEGDPLTGVLRLVYMISIHALAKRATVRAICETAAGLIFQSTPSQRGRHKAIFVRAKTYIISIHALAKRATRSCLSCGSFTVNFNPRPRKEGDICVQRLQGF